MFFKGDIIITDPCYIINDKNEYSPPSSERPIFQSFFPEGTDTSNPRISQLFPEEMKAYLDAQQAYQDRFKDDSRKCNYYENMSALGLKTWLTSDTNYGDWSCTTFNSDTHEPIGSFCADAGMVGVFLLSEVLEYNPDFNYHTDKPWTTTWIKDFEGEVDICEDDDCNVSVVGNGNIHFTTSQTEF